MKGGLRCLSGDGKVSIGSCRDPGPTSFLLCLPLWPWASQTSSHAGAGFLPGPSCYGRHSGVGPEAGDLEAFGSPDAAVPTFPQGG